MIQAIAASDDRLIPLLSEDAAPPLNALRVADVSARPGDEGVAVDVILSNESPIEGYTVVVGFDAAALEATSIAIAGTATGALAPEFTAPVIDSNAGFLSFSAIFDFMPPFENKLLAPGDVMCWPSGTGQAMATFLRSRGIEPRFVDWPQKPAATPAPAS